MVVERLLVKCFILIIMFNMEFLSLEVLVDFMEVDSSGLIVIDWVILFFDGC